MYDWLGICHVVVPQHGHMQPGLFCVGGDSHSPTGGAFGAYMFGIGATEMLGVVVTGEIWLQVPQTIFMHWSGALADGVSAKDMMLSMIGRYGMNGGQYQAVEFCGEAVAALPMDERMTLSNMSAELGAQVGLIAPDDTTRDWLARTAHPTSTPGPGTATRAHRACAITSTRRRWRRRWRCRTARPTRPRGRRWAHAHRQWPTSAPAPARSLTTCASLPACWPGAASPTCACWWRRPVTTKATAAARRHAAALIDAGAELLPSACGACAGYGSLLWRRTTRDLDHGAQLQGPHGRRVRAGLPRFPVHRGGQRCRGDDLDPRELL